MKNLYILVTNHGDGSYGLIYILDDKVIEALEEKDAAGEMEYDDIGCDGDGFHYETIRIPDECTPESMGISVMTLEDLED